VQFAPAPQAAYPGHMPNCYICGRPLNETRYRHRRQVKVGEWVRRNYASGKAQTVVNKLGPRIVCAGCAKRLDTRDLKSAKWQWIQICLLLGIVLILLLVRSGIF
jgi:hypothetical protein